MAYSTSIRTISAGIPDLLIDQIELPINHNDPRLRFLHDGTYGDYYGIFSFDEVWELNETIINENDLGIGRIKKNIELKTFLEKEKTFKSKTYLINIYEWESGL